MRLYLLMQLCEEYDSWIYGYGVRYFDDPVIGQGFGTFQAYGKGYESGRGFGY